MKLIDFPVIMQRSNSGPESISISTGRTIFFKNFSSLALHPSK
jgi:hypothetical protein